MSLVTGTPLGSVVSQEELYIEGAPYIYIQDYHANPLFNPDGDNYYYGMSGTAAYPASLIGCIQDVSLTQGLTMNDVRCDTVGVKDTIQKRNYIEFNLTILSQFPLSVFQKLANLSPATVGSHMEKVGIGAIDNNLHWMVYAPKIYDEVNGHWLLFHLHKAKFVDAWTLNMKFGESWSLTGVKIRAYADDTKPSGQRFGTIIRVDAGAI